MDKVGIIVVTSIIPIVSLVNKKEYGRITEEKIYYFIYLDGGDTGYDTVYPSLTELLKRYRIKKEKHIPCECDTKTHSGVLLEFGWDSGWDYNTLHATICERCMQIIAEDGK